MTFYTNALASMTEANKNFSRAVRLVGENGTAVILKNNVPRNRVAEFSQAEAEQLVSAEDVLSVSTRLMGKHGETYEALAK